MILFATALIISLAFVLALSLQRRKRHSVDLGVVSDHWLAQQRGQGDDSAP